MSDSIDVIVDNESQILEKTINNVSSQSKQRELTPTGFCYNCEEPVEGSKLFCCAECRDEYHHYISCLKRNGKL